VEEEDGFVRVPGLGRKQLRGRWWVVLLRFVFYYNLHSYQLRLGTLHSPPLYSALCSTLRSAKWLQQSPQQSCCPIITLKMQSFRCFLSDANHQTCTLCTRAQPSHFRHSI
jgi:hypothetical protein